MTRQLALPLAGQPRLRMTDYLPSSANAAARAWLRQPALWPNLQLAVYGEAGVGKTHLMHVFAEQTGAVLLPGEAVRHMPELPDAGGVAVDDADAAPEPEALLHLLNAAAERRLPVLLSGRTPPARWRVALPDLASRLRAITTVALGQPDDEMLRALLARLLAERQLRVDPAVQDYLLARLPRQGAALREAAACLDRVSLASGRAVTRATAAEVVARLDANACAGPAHADTAPSRDHPLLL